MILRLSKKGRPVFWMWHVFSLSYGSLQHLVLRLTRSLFTGGGDANKLGHTSWVSGWFGGEKKKGKCSGGEEEGAKQLQDAQAVVDWGGVAGLLG